MTGLSSWISSRIIRALLTGSEIKNKAVLFTHDSLRTLQTTQNYKQELRLIRNFHFIEKFVPIYRIAKH